MSAVSMNVTPRSSARRIVAIDSSQSGRPYASLIPMQPRPWAETVSSPSETRRMSVPACRGFGRENAAAVVADLGVEQLQAFLLLEQGLADALAVLPQQVNPFLLVRARAHQLRVAQHVPHRHAGGPQPAYQQQPVQVGVAEAPAPVRGARDAVEQADPLVPAERVLRQAALLRGLPGRPA